MITAFRIFYTTIGRKLLMALTGLFLCLFLVEHLYGNLMLYKYDGGIAFNEYTETMTGNLLIRMVEYVLFAGIIIHSIDGLMLTMSNRRARPVRYEVSRQAQNSTWFSRNMGLTGAIIFVFLVIHLREFFVPHRFGAPEDSMAYDVAEAFQSPWYSALYVFAMVWLGAHLNHGFQSAFQTLGWNNHKYMFVMKYAATTFAVVMAVGFASFPVMFYYDVCGIATDILNTSVK